MIIFTITNKVTGQVYVGSTRNDLECQWAKIQAATEQGLDFPLYRAIRTHGEDAFDVEEWDRAEDRQELLELEEEAIERLGAISLRGHKTSTVVIRPKKKVRKRKSAADKEVAFLLAQIQSEDATVDDLPPPTNLSSPKTDDENQDTAPKGQVIKKAQQPEATAAVSKPVASPVAGTKPAAVSQARPVQQPQQEKSVPAQATAVAAEAAAKSQGSTSSARVELPEINLDSDISSQLAAIQAAADAVLAGNSGAASSLSMLDKQPAAKPEATIAEIKPQVQQPQPEPEPEIDERTRRMMDAVKRHRQQIAQHSPETDKQEQNKLAVLLADMDTRAQEMTQAANNATEGTLSLITANAA
ncbi:GIY-YIG nuclease family protein [Spongorhabdus nitratireducens]